MVSEQALTLCDDLEKRLGDLCWIHDRPGLYLSEYFFELRTRIDIDTEEHLQALKAKSHQNIEISLVQANNVRNEFIGKLTKIEDGLQRPISAAAPVSSPLFYGSLKQKVDQFKEDTLQEDVDVNLVKYAYSCLVVEILQEKNELRKRLFRNQTIIYHGENKLEGKLGYLIYFADEYLSKEEVDCLK